MSCQKGDICHYDALPYRDIIKSEVTPMSTAIPFSQVKDVIQRLFPDYKGRRDVYVMSAESVELTGTYWSGGSRSSYAAYEPITKATRTLPRFDPPQFGGPVNTPKVPLCDGNGHYIVIAERHHGSFEYITLFVHPDNMVGLLPSPVELDMAQKIVLVFTRGLKSSYAGIPDYRFHEAHERTGITRQKWDAAKAECIAKGLLNKAGAITADGKNAAGIGDYLSFERGCMAE